MIEKKESMDQFKIKLHYILAPLLLLHCVFFMVYWIAVGDFRGDVDQFIGDAAGLDLPYTLILMVLTVVVGFWSLIRFVQLRLLAHQGYWKPSAGSWIYSGIWLLFIAVFYASFVIILRQVPNQRGIILHLLSLSRLVSDAILFLFAALGLRRLILYLRRKLRDAQHKWPWTVGIVLVLMSVVGVWLLPMLFPPNWAYQGDLPSKPALIAHRGASMLAPENTLGAVELADVHQALGFETDLRISLDGVPFLMHDETLARTTNIAEVFQERVDDLASSFTLEELKQLNAGLWFIQKDPFGTIDLGMVSQTQLSINQGQRIPTLEEALAEVEEKGMMIMFDMRYPPEDHPYYEDFFDIVLETCLESGLNGDIWFLVDEDRVDEVMEKAPQMTRVVGLSSSDIPNIPRLVNLGYEIVNVDYGITARDILDYREQGLGVNVYTVDEPWLFSQFWLSGVTSVTTNNVHTFNDLSTPLINIPYSRFLLFWSVYGIIIAIWLAASQPEQEPFTPRQMETPDLMDFAIEDDETVDTTKPEVTSVEPASIEVQETEEEQGSQEEPAEPTESEESAKPEKTEEQEEQKDQEA
jgi:glycerophosphoryl diester phosphodiesterase